MLLLYGKLRSPQPYHLAVLLSSVHGIAHCVDPHGNPCTCGLQTGISRALVIPLEQLYGNPRKGQLDGHPSGENASLCAAPGQNEQA